MYMIAKLMLNITTRLKPILLKIFPYKLLRKLKGRMITKSLKKLETMEIASFDKNEFPFGVNLIGNIKSETGLGQSCRLLANELNSSAIPYIIYNYTQLGACKNTDNSWTEKISDVTKYSINIIHINPHEFGLALMQLDRKMFDNHYNIAFWLWELEEFPEEWSSCFNVIDEIWTPSEFISNSIRKRTTLPVRTIPYFVSVDIKKEYSRKDFGLPEYSFLYLMMYDSGSIMERKNPLGAIKAFKKAFSKDDFNVGLVIKISNHTENDIRIIKSILDGYRNIYFINEVLSKDEVNSLIKIVDVYVSLHRAEGFGLVLAEAMLLGTPTIASNWSANTEFMNDDIACMVNVELIRIERNIGPFKKGSYWADPNISQAAVFMRKLYEEKEYCTELSKKAENYVKNKLSKNKIINLIELALDDKKN